MTVLALLLTVGLSVGFGVRGWWGVLAGVGTPLLLAFAFRNGHLRKLLGRLADWAIGPPG